MPSRAPSSRRPRCRIAIAKLGFVQATIRAPARAQDLTLRHRVGLPRRRPEQRALRRACRSRRIFVNYGRARAAPPDAMSARHAPWTKARWAQAHAVLDHARAWVHPKDVDAEFAHGKTGELVRRLVERQHAAVLDGTRTTAARCANGEGGSGLSRHVGRPRQAIGARRIDALIDAIVAKYQRRSSPRLANCSATSAAGVPQWRAAKELARAKARCARARTTASTGFRPADERLRRGEPQDAPAGAVRPAVWDHAFRGLGPTASACHAGMRQLGYHALPLWRDESSAGPMPRRPTAGTAAGLLRRRPRPCARPTAASWTEVERCANSPAALTVASSAARQALAQRQHGRLEASTAALTAKPAEAMNPPSAMRPTTGSGPTICPAAKTMVSRDAG